MHMIYKIITPDAWADMATQGSLTPSGVDGVDGYVHFSTAAQLSETLDKHYAGHGDLVLLAADAESLGAALKWEISRNDALFPHLYAAFQLIDVSENFALSPRRDGLGDWLLTHEKKETA